MNQLGVAEAKRRFSELTDRVARGETFLVERRGKPAMALVSPCLVPAGPTEHAPVGLAAVAGELAEWEDMDEVIAEIVAARQRAQDRPAPRLS